MKSFACGLIIGCAFTYITFQSHVIWTGDGMMFVPKLPAVPLNDTFADVREWTTADWQKHPQLYAAIRNANRLDVTQPQPTAAVPADAGESNQAMDRFLNGAFQSAPPQVAQPGSRGPTAQQPYTRPNSPPPQVTRDVPGPVRSWNDPRYPMRGTNPGQPVRPVYNRFQDELDRSYRESRSRVQGAAEPTTSVRPTSRSGQPSTQPVDYGDSTAAGPSSREAQDARGS